jgi:hypothetical protein
MPFQEAFNEVFGVGGGAEGKNDDAQMNECVFIIDLSGSVGDEIKQLYRFFISGMSQTGKFNVFSKIHIVAYGSDAIYYGAFSPLQIKVEALEVVNQKFKYPYGTHVESAYATVLTIPSKENINVVVELTDGQYSDYDVPAVVKMLHGGLINLKVHELYAFVAKDTRWGTMSEDRAMNVAGGKAVYTALTMEGSRVGLDAFGVSPVQCSYLDGFKPERITASEQAEGIGFKVNDKMYPVPPGMPPQNAVTHFISLALEFKGELGDISDFVMQAGVFAGRHVRQSEHMLEVVIQCINRHPLDDSEKNDMITTFSAALVNGRRSGGKTRSVVAAFEHVSRATQQQSFKDANSRLSSGGIDSFPGDIRILIGGKTIPEIANGMHLVPRSMCVAGPVNGPGSFFETAKSSAKVLPTSCPLTEADIQVFRIAIRNTFASFGWDQRSPDIIYACASIVAVLLSHGCDPEGSQVSFAAKMVAYLCGAKQPSRRGYSTATRWHAVANGADDPFLKKDKNKITEKSNPLGLSFDALVELTQACLKNNPAIIDFYMPAGSKFRENIDNALSLEDFSVRLPNMPPMQFVECCEGPIDPVTLETLSVEDYRSGNVVTVSGCRCLYPYAMHKDSATQLRLGRGGPCPYCRETTATFNVCFDQPDTNLSQLQLMLSAKYEYKYSSINDESKESAHGNPFTVHVSMIGTTNTGKTTCVAALQNQLIGASDRNVQVITTPELVSDTYSKPEEGTIVFAITSMDDISGELPEDQFAKSAIVRQKEWLDRAPERFQILSEAAIKLYEMIPNSSMLVVVSDMMTHIKSCRIPVLPSIGRANVSFQFGVVPRPGEELEYLAFSMSNTHKHARPRDGDPINKVVQVNEGTPVFKGIWTTEMKIEKAKTQGLPHSRIRKLEQKPTTAQLIAGNENVAIFKKRFLSEDGSPKDMRPIHELAVKFREMHPMSETESNASELAKQILGADGDARVAPAPAVFVTSVADAAVATSAVSATSAAVTSFASVATSAASAAVAAVAASAASVASAFSTSAAASAAPAASAVVAAPDTNVPQDAPDDNEDDEYPGGCWEGSDDVGIPAFFF